MTEKNQTKTQNKAMKTKALKIINLIVAVLVSVFALGHAFAWLVGNRLEDLQDFNGSSGSPYFASGTGAQNDPFIITNQYHMYNLAWLQNTGKFDKQYYFQVGNDISIPENFWLPPIGTDTNPFEGVFNGKGYKITNLQVTTDNSKLTGVVSGASVKYSNAVGMFGMTDAGADISNFILEKPVVEVANANATYSTTANKVAGLAVGHVAQDSKVYSIGVLADQTGTKLLMNKGGYSTFNSIIGELAEGVESSVTGGGHTSGGSGANFGASLDVESLYTRLIRINDNSSASWRLPGISTDNDNLTLSSLDKLPFTVTEDSTYTGTAAKEVIASNSVGYLIGNQNKVYSKTRKFGDPLVEDANGKYTFANGKTPSSSSTIPLWLYRETYENIASDSYNRSSGFSALSTEEFNALPENIKSLIDGFANGDNIDSIRIQQQYQNVGAQIYPGTDSNSQWSPRGQISWNGKTYGDGFRKGSYKDPVVNEEGVYLTAEGNLLDDTYYSTTSKYYEYVLNNGVKNYLPDTQYAEWTLPIYSIDEKGYAKNIDGEYYDAGGEWLIDENGYAYNDLGYIVTNGWPFGDTYIGDDGYIMNSDGTYYIDAVGGRVYAYGYDSVNQNGHLVKDGQVATVAVDNYYANLSARKGTYITAKVGFTCEFYRYTKGIALPNSGIWFKPAQAGMIRLIMYAEKAGDGFALLKGHRTSATSDNPFYVDYNRAGADVTATEVMKFTLPSYVLFYFEYEVTQADIDDGRIEFWLAKYGNNGAYFVYMDIGASGMTGDTGEIDHEKAVSAVDFIYSGVSIAQADDRAETPKYHMGDFIVTSSATLYEATGTSIYFDKLDTILEIIFLRKAVNEEQTMQVTVTGTTDDTKVTATNTGKVEFIFNA